MQGQVFFAAMAMIFFQKTTLPTRKNKLQLLILRQCPILPCTSLNTTSSWCWHSWYSWGVIFLIFCGDDVLDQNITRYGPFAKHHGFSVNAFPQRTAFWTKRSPCWACQIRIEIHDPNCLKINDWQIVLWGFERTKSMKSFDKQMIPQNRKKLYQIRPDSRLKTIHIHLAPRWILQNLRRTYHFTHLYTMFCQLQNAWLYYPN